MRIGASLLTLSLVPLLACVLVFTVWLPRADRLTSLPPFKVAPSAIRAWVVL